MNKIQESLNKKRSNIFQERKKSETRYSANTICGKITYESKSKAKKALKKLISSPDYLKKTNYIHTYFCDKCKNFHIGHLKYGELRSSQYDE